jgi:hypothetical protein
MLLPKFNRIPKNTRRFYRIDMPLRYLAYSNSTATFDEIYSTGMVYFTPIVEKQIKTKEAELYRSLHKLSEHKTVITRTIHEAQSWLSLIREGVQMISQGVVSPMREREYQARIGGFIREGLHSVKLLKEPAPKTYAIFYAIQELLVYNLSLLRQVALESSSDSFHAPELRRDFAIHRHLPVFRSEKYAKIPMIQMLLALTELVDAHAEPFHQMILDHAYRKNPSKWPETLVNFSEGGAALWVKKQFVKNETITLSLYLPYTKQLCTFTAHVVSVEPGSDGLHERVALNFHFPDGKAQESVRREIQYFEIKEAMEA